MIQMMHIFENGILTFQSFLAHKEPGQVSLSPLKRFLRLICCSHRSSLLEGYGMEIICLDFN